MSANDQLKLLDAAEDIVGSNAISQAIETKARLFSMMPEDLSNNDSICKVVEHEPRIKKGRKRERRQADKKANKIAYQVRKENADDNFEGENAHKRRSNEPISEESSETSPRNRDFIDKPAISSRSNCLPTGISLNKTGTTAAGIVVKINGPLMANHEDPTDTADTEGQTDELIPFDTLRNNENVPQKSNVLQIPQIVPSPIDVLDATGPGIDKCISQLSNPTPAKLSSKAHIERQKKLGQPSDSLLDGLDAMPAARETKAETIELFAEKGVTSEPSENKTQVSDMNFDPAAVKAGARVIVLAGKDRKSWQATIQDRKTRKGEQGFMIHYDGKKKTMYDWVPVTSVVNYIFADG